jgi:hypothetical protein
MADAVATPVSPGAAPKDVTVKIKEKKNIFIAVIAACRGLIGLPALKIIKIIM